jgi:hypothetical protein
MRISLGKDENSPGKRFDSLFWSIAAGLDLYDQAKGRKSEPKDFSADFHKAFGNRPIEVPGGLGRLSFEVVKHEEPSWWKQVFSFLQGTTGQRLVSVLGFPAITNQAINALNELLNRFAGTKPASLFKSRPMRLALSQHAHDAMTGGSARVKMGALRPGFCILARRRDYETLKGADVVFYPTVGKLAPAAVTVEQLVSGFADPLQDVTYAVFRVGMKGARLDPTFNYA